MSNKKAPSAELVDFVEGRTQGDRDKLLDKLFPEFAELLCQELLVYEEPKQTGEHVDPIDAEQYAIKLLLYIGIPPRDPDFAVCVRILYLCIAYPTLSLNEVVADFARTHGCRDSAVFRIIDKNFDIYNNSLLQRVTALTKSRPQTAREALYDLSVFTNFYFRDRVLRR